MIGHTIGNLMLAMHAQQSHDALSGIRALSQLLFVNHTVVPVTFANVKLVARYSNGDVRETEEAIDAYRGDELVEELTIEPDTAWVSDPAREAIMRAQVVIVAPGSLYSSLLPVLQMGGVSRLLRQSRAPKFFVCNTMTQKGDTHGYCVSDFISVIERAMTCSLDRVLVDVSQHDSSILDLYAKKDQFPVALSDVCRQDTRILGARIAASRKELVRHDYDQLASALSDMIDEVLGQQAPYRQSSVTPVSGSLSPVRS